MNEEVLLQSREEQGGGGGGAEGEKREVGQGSGREINQLWFPKDSNNLAFFIIAAFIPLSSEQSHEPQPLVSTAAEERGKYPGCGENL